MCVCQNADIAGVGTSGSATVDEKEKSSGRVEDQINDEHLRCIEAMFHEADIEGEGGRNTHTHTHTEHTHTSKDQLPRGSLWAITERKKKKK